MLVDGVYSTVSYVYIICTALYGDVRGYVGRGLSERLRSEVCGCRVRDQPRGYLAYKPEELRA